MEIYLDNLASTPIDPRVAAHQAEVAVALRGNPNSAEHASGTQSANVLTKAREDVGAFLGAAREETHFLPSASSALWLALEDAIARRGVGLRVLASAIEHPSLLQHLQMAASAGRIRLDLFPVNVQGQPDLSRLEGMAQGGVDLICAMAANNEIGTIAPVEDILRLADRHGALAIVDASQAAGRFRLDQVTAAANYVVASGAKMNGPRRVGVLAGKLKRPTADLIEPMFGTPDAAAASAMAVACGLVSDEMEHDERRIALLRDRLETILTERVPGLRVNGDRSARLAGALHVSSPAIPAEVLVARLWGKVALSSGAACQSGVPGSSHVLTAMGLEDWVVEGGVRMCVGKFNDAAEIERAAAIISEAMSADLGIRRQA